LFGGWSQYMRAQSFQHPLAAEVGASSNRSVCTKSKRLLSGRSASSLLPPVDASGGGFLPKCGEPVQSKTTDSISFYKDLPGSGRSLVASSAVSFLATSKASQQRVPSDIASTPLKVLSLLHKAYGVAQVGALDEKLKGFDLNAEDDAADLEFDLTYGEMLPQGVSKVLGRLVTSPTMQVMLDLGMGTGKLALQAFLEVPQLLQVIGVELTHARFEIAAKALRRLATRDPARFELLEDKGADGRSQSLRLLEGPRELTFRRGDIFKLSTGLITKADIIVMAVAFPPDMFCRVQQLLGISKHGCHLLTYEDFKLGSSHKWHPPVARVFHRMKCNREGDCYSVSWLPNPGHRFHLHKVEFCIRPHGNGPRRASTK